MGVDTRIVLNDSARVRDVADFIALLAGNPYDKGYYESRGFVRVEGVSVEGSVELPECARITFKDWVGESRQVLYHFENEEGGRLLCPRSTPFWISIGCKLIELFGGYIDYSDSDSIEVDEKVRSGLVPKKLSIDENFNKMENLKMKTRPIEPEFFKSNVKHAAYDDESMWQPYYDGLILLHRDRLSGVIDNKKSILKRERNRV